VVRLGSFCRLSPVLQEGRPFKSVPCVWAALRTLGRTSLADLIDHSCDYARHFADALGATGYQMLNEVVLDLVLVSFGSPEVTRRVIAGPCRQMGRVGVAARCGRTRLR
jgi:glutamate/tyrosine decarboxylase-like PLP-dependent enzyme